MTAVILAAEKGKAQGSFQNLNFEEADPVVVVGSPFYPYTVTTASALPNWTVAVGATQQTQIMDNDPSLGAPAVMLVSSGPGTGSFLPINGNYSVLLTGSFPSALPSISQTGIIPAGAQTLLFKADPGVGGMNVSIGNENVAFSAVSTGPNYTLYGANISAWAGQAELLSFTAEQSPGLNNWEIDDISFSPNSVVPEPSPLALMGIGGFLFAFYRRFAPKW